MRALLVEVLRDYSPDVCSAALLQWVFYQHHCWSDFLLDLMTLYLSGRLAAIAAEAGAVRYEDQMFTLVKSFWAVSPGMFEFTKPVPTSLEKYDQQTWKTRMLLYNEMKIDLAQVARSEFARLKSKGKSNRQSVHEYGPTWRREALQRVTQRVGEGDFIAKFGQVSAVTVRELRCKELLEMKVSDDTADQALHMRPGTKAYKMSIDSAVLIPEIAKQRKKAKTDIAYQLGTKQAATSKLEAFVEVLSSVHRVLGPVTARQTSKQRSMIFVPVASSYRSSWSATRGSC